MPFFRVIFRTAGDGRFEQVFEAKSRAIAEQASRRACLPGCKVFSVESAADPDAPAAPVSDGPVGPPSAPLLASARREA